jgi:hypothetical protein
VKLFEIKSVVSMKLRGERLVGVEVTLVDTPPISAKQAT